MSRINSIFIPRGKNLFRPLTLLATVIGSIMRRARSAFVPYKKILFLPPFALVVFAGSIFILWSGTMVYRELEARRDAEEFSQGQYDSVAWAEFTAQDPALTRQGLAVRLYNEGIVYVTKARAITDKNKQTSLLNLAAYKFQEAFFEAEKRNDLEMMSKSASALGATLLKAGLNKQEASYLEQADVMFVKALTLNPKDQAAKWNLELLRRLYKPSEEPGNGDDGDDVGPGPGGMDPGKGGL